MMYCIPSSDGASENYGDRNQMRHKISFSILLYSYRIKYCQRSLNPCTKISPTMVVMAHQPHRCQTNNFAVLMQTCARESSSHGANSKRTTLGWNTENNKKTLTSRRLKKNQICLTYKQIIQLSFWKKVSSLVFWMDFCSNVCCWLGCVCVF